MRFLAPALLAALLLAYWPALRGGFIWDDDRYVTENSALAAAGGFSQIWRVGVTPQYYPLTFSTFWLERRLWGLDPFGYHLVNVLLHAANAVLFGLVLRRLGLPSVWLAAALFALHPLEVESVAWISERKNLLSGLFTLLSALCWLKFDEDDGGARYAAALVLFSAALLSKTTACTLPAAFALARWLSKRPLDLKFWKRLSPFLAIGCAMGLLTIRVEIAHEGAAGPDFELSLVARALLACRSLWFYAGKLVWPFRLSFVYERWTIDPHDPAAWLYPGGAALLAACAWHWRRGIPRGAAAAAVYFAATLFPALGFFKVYPQRYSYVADHFQYMAGLGPIAATAALPSRARTWLGPPVLAALWASTWMRAHAFETAEGLWRDTLRKNPAAFLAHVNLGKILQDQGRTDEAVLHYREALRLKPALPEVHINWGNIELSSGRADLAEAEFRKALAASEDGPMARAARNSLGAALLRQGKTGDAEAIYQGLVGEEPEDFSALNNLCAVLNAAGKPREAYPYCQRALAARPDCSQCRATLNEVLRSWKGG